MHIFAQRRPVVKTPAQIVSALDAVDRVPLPGKQPLAASESSGAQALPASEGDSPPAYTTHLGSIDAEGPSASASGEFWGFTLAAFWVAVLCCAAILAFAVFAPKKPVVLDAVTPSAFTVGSTRQLVRAVQGEPTATEENVWHYGASKVYFQGNFVVRWRVAPGNPLKASPRMK